MSTHSDPRLLALASGDVGPCSNHQPTKEHQFKFYPTGEAVTLVHRAPVSLIDGRREVFLKKWPGIVTGFDKLFKHKDRRALEHRIGSLFRSATLGATQRSNSADDLAKEIGANEQERAKLVLLTAQIAREEMTFEPDRLRRSVAGSAPREVAWYPDQRMTTWIYYEPKFTFERAVHENRRPGWGTSNQWRDPASHEINPKFVFTTSTNPAAGLKAFVLTGDWLVIKAAGMRQQLNYTGINNPLRQQEFASANNLGGEAADFYDWLTKSGRHEQDFLLYLAAIYNSSLAQEYLDHGGHNALRIPLAIDLLDSEAVLQIIERARRVRNLAQLEAEAQSGEVSQEVAAPLETEPALLGFGFERRTLSGGRFRPKLSWEVSHAARDAMLRAKSELQALLNEDVLALFEALPSE